MTERQLQRAVAQYFAAVLDPAKVLYLHCPNEGKRGKFARADFKLGGGLPGVADWLLCWSAPWRAEYKALQADYPNANKRAAWIELKSAGGKLSGAQGAFAERVRSLGHYCIVCRDLEAVEDALRVWGCPMRPHKLFGTGAVKLLDSAPRELVSE